MKRNNHFNYTDSQSRHLSVGYYKTVFRSWKELCHGVCNQRSTCTMNKMSLRFPHKKLGSSLLPVVCRRAHVLFTLFVFICAQWCVANIVLCFMLFFFVLCALFCQCLWIVHFLLLLLYSLLFSYSHLSNSHCRNNFQINITSADLLPS